MAFLAFVPLLVLLLAALLIWAMNGRARTFSAGLIALAALLIALGLTAGWQMAPQAPVAASLVWGTLNDQPLLLRFNASGLPGFPALTLLLSGCVVAGGLAWTFGRATRAFDLVFAGLLVLIVGGLVTMYSDTPLGAILGLGSAWLGGTIMQQSAAAHGPDARFGTLPLLLLIVTLLVYGATPQFDGGQLIPGAWLAGCAVLIAVAPRWSTTPTAPLLVRAPAIALGLPLLGGYLLTRYASTAGTLPQPTLAILLVIGIAALLIGSINALTARRLGDAFGWQIVAQLAFIPIAFGTGQPAAGPIATGLLAHTLITASGSALAIGQLERVTRTDLIAAMPPLPQPLRRAGLAYGLAALSAAGIPPLLGYNLRHVLLLLAAGQPWLPPLLLGASTLLALSYLPTLAAFFRRPAFRSPLAAVEQRGGGWLLALMLGLLIAGRAPDQLWQLILGDPSAQVQLPSIDAFLSNPGVAFGELMRLLVTPSFITSGIVALLALILLGLISRALRHPRQTVYFAGGEPLDEEPGWALPFVALRRTLWPLVVPDRLVPAAIGQWINRRSGQLTLLRHAVERRYYLAIVVVGLITVLLLAAQ